MVFSRKRADRTDSAVEALLNRRIQILCGKGGVGKSTMVAALALLAQRRGYRVLVVELDTVPTVVPLFGGTPADGFEAQTIHTGIDAMSVSGHKALEEYLLMVLRSRRFAEKIFQNKVYQYFVAAAPGLKELMAIGKIWFVAQLRDGWGPRYDRILTDMPATGHSVSYLRMPQTAVDTLKIGFVKNEAQKVLSLLSDPERTVCHIVTLPEEMPVNETIEMDHTVRGDLELPPGCIFINRVYPNPLPPGSDRDYETLRRKVDEKEEMEVLRPIFNCADSCRRRWASHRVHIDKLKGELPGPFIEIPYIFSREFRLDSIERIARHLEGETGLGSSGGRRRTRSSRREKSPEDAS